MKFLWKGFTDNMCFQFNWQVKQVIGEGNVFFRANESDGLPAHHARESLVCKSVTYVLSRSSESHRVLILDDHYFFCRGCPSTAKKFL